MVLSFGDVPLNFNNYLMKVFNVLLVMYFMY
jgi:hypothetical protein